MKQFRLNIESSTKTLSCFIYFFNLKKCGHLYIFCMVIHFVREEFSVEEFEYLLFMSLSISLLIRIWQCEAGSSMSSTSVRCSSALLSCWEITNIV